MTWGILHKCMSPLYSRTGDAFGLQLVLVSAQKKDLMSRNKKRNGIGKQSSPRTKHNKVPTIDSLAESF